MNSIIKYITTLRNVGKKPVGKESHSNIYHIHDDAKKCTLNMYIEIAFRNNLNALIIEGNPPVEELTNARNEIINEFTEATGNHAAGILSRSLHKLFRLKSKIACYQLILNLIFFDEYDKVEEQLKTMNYKVPTNEKEKQQLIQRIKTKIKTTYVSLSEESRKYNNLIKDSQGKEYTENDFEKQLSYVSKYMGYHIDKDKVTLIEYASYLNNYQKEIEYGIKRELPKH